MPVKKYVASEMVREATRRHQIHLAVLVAETALWADPEVHRRLLRQTNSAAMYPQIRRMRKGESRGEFINGVRLDDNTYANRAIKWALGLQQAEIEGFEACHIWPRTCYDERYHTAIANLVLIPRALAGLSDHDEEIQASLQYRAYELYQWYPEGFPTPQKPAFYPSQWRSPVVLKVSGSPQTSISLRRSGSTGKIEIKEVGLFDGQMSGEERRIVIERIRRWALRPDLNVHRIISIVVGSNYSISRHRLEQEAERRTKSKNAYGAIASLLTSKGNAYGRVFEEVDGMIRLHPAVEQEVRSLRWW